MAIRKPASFRSVLTRKGHNSCAENKIAISASTLFIGGAIASLLCLAIQLRIHSKTVHSHGHFLSHKSLIKFKEGRLKKHKKFELFALDGSEDKDNSNIVFQNENSNEEFRGEEGYLGYGITNDDASSLTRSLNFPPRVIHLQVPVSLLDLHHPRLLGTGDSPDGLESEDKPSMDEVKNVSIATKSDVDDEDEAQALEDKQAMHENRDSEDGDNKDECVPMGKWQTSSPVNCNVFHEIDLFTSIMNADKKHKKAKAHVITNENNESLPFHHDPLRHPTWDEAHLTLLGQGWFRAAWRLDRRPPDREDPKEDETIILKMLRPEREFTIEFFELHRRDAVAMEQLTHSKFVLNIYGYCGQSALNEFANFRIPELSSLEKFDRQLRGKEKTPKINRMKLKLAVSVAAGVADAHELPADIAGDKRASMVHYDLNPRNVAIVKGAMPKLNDFNTARFLKYNPKTNQTCGSEANLHEPWWRAPEEVDVNQTNPTVDEKADIWALGNLLFHILTTHSPRGQMKAYRMEEVRQHVLQGIPPHLPTEYAASKHPAVVAFRKAMDMCFQKNPRKRASAREVSNTLLDALLALNDNDDGGTK